MFKKGDAISRAPQLKRYKQIRKRTTQTRS